MRHLLTATLLLFSILFTVGCPQVMAPASLGPIVQTSIPEGIYSGSLTMTMTASIDGAVQERQETTEPYNEIVDVNGLPLVQPDGVPPQQNRVFRYDFAGSIIESTITAVHGSGTRLVVNYRTTMTLDGYEIAGLGTWTYNFVAPDTLEFTDTFYGVSEVVNGHIAGVQWIGSATLSK